jgi:hyaluronoglucosaminidase
VCKIFCQKNFSAVKVKVENQSQTAYMLLLLVFLSISAAKSFPQYWNVDESQAPLVDVTQFNFHSRNWTQVGNECSQPIPSNCSSWTQGLFPTISSDGTIINGGVPQNGNLTLHLEAITTQLPTWIPEKNWAGNAVLDFESWTTVWELNDSPGDWHSKRYQNYSIQLANGNVVKAMYDFQTAATEWFVQTLLLCRKLRPYVNVL